MNVFVRGGMSGGWAGWVEEKDPVLDEVAEILAAVVAGDVVEVKAVTEQLAETVTAVVADTVVEGMVVVMVEGGDEDLGLLSAFSWNLLLVSVSALVCTGGILLCLGRTAGFGLLVFC